MHLRLGESQLRAGLLHGLLPRRHRCSGLIHLIHGDELLRQQRLNAVKVVGLIQQLGLGAVEGGLRVRDIGFRFVNGREAARSTFAAALVGICVRSSYCAYL